MPAKVSMRYGQAAVPDGTLTLLRLDGLNRRGCMIQFDGTSADVVWHTAAERLLADGTVQESRDQTTRELLHVALVIEDPRQRLVFARPINPAFALAEVLWILAGANDTAFLAFWNPRMARYADDHAPHRLHGAYGYRLGSQPRLSEAASATLRHEEAGATRLDQVRVAYEALHHINHSRQVVLQIWDSTRDLPNPEPRSKDVPCNVVAHLMVRQGKLEWLQVMRSNDLVWGLPYNFVQFTSLQEIVAGWLDVEVGTYTHLSDSLHAYQRHWGKVSAAIQVAETAPQNAADLRIKSYDEWETLWGRLIDGALALTRETKAEALLAVAGGLQDIPAGYKEWVAVLTAEALHRRGFTASAEEIIAHAGPFWGTSWRRWRDAHGQSVDGET